MKIITCFFLFILKYKKTWLPPLTIVLILMFTIILLAQNSVHIPFVYSTF